MPTAATDVSNAMAYIYKMRGIKAQFTRWDDTLRHFRAASTIMEGERKVFKAWTQPMTATRLTKSGYESEFPEDQKLDAQEYYVTWSDLSEAQTTVAFTGLAQAKTTKGGRRAAIWNIANKLIDEVDADHATRLNAAVHQDANCTMATIDTLYNAAGTGAYSSGAAYAKIKAGSISQFFKGQKLHVRNGSSTSTPRCIVEVNDVFPFNEGPDGTRARGPGIRFTYSAAGADSDLGNVAADDDLCLSNEAADNFWGFPTWFSRTAAVVNLTRTSTGNAWTIPPIKWFDASGDGTGASVTFDLDTHLGEVAEELAYAVKYGRRTRASEGIELTTKAMTMLTTPRIVSEASGMVGDQMRYAMSLGDPERKKYFGVTGYDGAFWHHPLLGPIAFQPDPVATPDVLRMLEPNSWTWVIGHQGGINDVEWLDKDGNKFHYPFGANARLINRLVGGALRRVTLICDQPGANLQLGGVKSSRQ